MITYALEPDLSVRGFAALLRSSGLAPRRPGDPEQLDRMLRAAQAIVTARADGALVGVARSITDLGLLPVLLGSVRRSGLAGQGIGRAPLAQTAQAAPDVQTCLLLSAPAAVSFYEAAGYARRDQAFIFHKR
ncbi:MAG: GNAT family N-acetyltransferase [Roseinatronobacter sp.]